MSQDLQTHAAPKRVAPAPVGTPEDVLRANTYSLLGRLMAAPPDTALLERLTGIAPAADDSVDLLGAAWQMLGQAAGRTTSRELDDEYHDLFIGVGRGELMPYGSWYMTGFLMEQPLSRLRADLSRLGFERQDGVTEPEDHAAALCEVMAMIATGGSGEQGAFFHRHMAPWLARYFRDMQAASSARFYRAVGQLGEQFMDVEARYLQSWQPGDPAGAGQGQN